MWQRYVRRYGAAGGGYMRRFLLAGAISLAGVLVIAGAGLVVYSTMVLPELPELRAGERPELPTSTVAYTADGKELARYFHQKRTWRQLEDISQEVVHALVATEDRNFYEHDGVDIPRLISAAYSTALGDRQGASTISMQLARNLYPEKIGRSATLTRKLKEVVTALKLERHFSKDEILEIYLNTVPFSFHSFGIEAAAETYFNKRAQTLTAREGAVLVGMLKGPTFYNPVFHPDRARKRRNIVLRQMAAEGYLTEADHRTARRAPLDLDFQPPLEQPGIAPYFAEHVRRELAEWGRANGYNIYTDGLRVHTTLDSRMQSAARRSAREQAAALESVAAYEWSRPSNYWLSESTAPYASATAEPFAYFWERYGDPAPAEGSDNGATSGAPSSSGERDSLRAAHARLQVGMVAMEPSSGYVKAWVGGRGFARNQYDHVSMAQRQPGSTFKPFVYASAIAQGYSPRDIIRDSVRSYRYEDYSVWRPRNAGGSSGRYVTLRQGLAYSMNTVTARLMWDVGPYSVAQVAEKAGIGSTLRAVPSLALGTSEVTLFELVESYATLASSGTHRDPVVITRIEEADGTVLYRHEPAPQQALPAYTVYPVLDMMRDVVDYGTGSGIRRTYGLEGDLAGKTGTTEKNRDGWFVLMHPQLVTGAWVGFDDPRLHFRSQHWGQGGNNALRVVGDFYRTLQDSAGYLPANVQFSKPPGYVPPAPFLTRARAVTAGDNVDGAEGGAGRYGIDPATLDSFDYSYELSLDSSAVSGYSRRAPRPFVTGRPRPPASPETHPGSDAEELLRRNMSRAVDTSDARGRRAVERPQRSRLQGTAIDAGEARPALPERGER